MHLRTIHCESLRRTVCGELRFQFPSRVCNKIRMINYNNGYAQKVDTYVSGRFVGALQSYLADAKFSISGVDTRQARRPNSTTSRKVDK